LKINLYLWVKLLIDMHDSEPETFVLQTFPQKFSDFLANIGIESKAKEIGSDDIEKDEYYSRYFSQTPRMVTNKGCLQVIGKNIDIIQIIQKG